MFSKIGYKEETTIPTTVKKCGKLQALNVFTAEDPLN